MIHAAIFDVDGTLVDTVDMHAAAWQRAFRDFGKDFEYDAIRSQIGKGGDQFLPMFLNEKELKEFGEAVEKRRGEIYEKEFLPTVRAFPKVRELFERIRGDGVEIALASSAPDEELEVYKKVTGIADLIAAAASADDAERSKPEPDIFAAALESLGSPDPATCVVVGDTPYDAIAARRAGIRCIGLLSGGFPRESLTESGCIQIYRDTADLLESYDRSAIAAL